MLILVDSIGKYLTGIRDAEILSYRGETIGEFIHKIRSNIIKLNRYTHIIVHVGTNNVLNNKPGEILSLYRTLIHLIKQKYKNIIVGISSILPRPKDHSLSGTDIKNVNLGLAKICKDEQVFYSLDPTKDFSILMVSLKEIYLQLEMAGYILMSRVYFSSNWLSPM